MNLQRVPVFALAILLLANTATCSEKQISKRAAVVYQRGATATILAALALPVDIQNRHVYVAINFSANYVSPQNASTYTRPFDRFHQKNRREISDPGPVSRSSFYKSIVRELNRYGMNGKWCLMSTICEVSSVPVDLHNGVVGSLMQLAFSPSLSYTERDLPGKFYEAEKLGREGNCGGFRDKCPVNLLDMVSHFE